MRLPAIEGIIRRRMLVNYRVDPEVVGRILPSRFRPKLHRGYAVAGVCLIRLEYVRPTALPEAVGLASENAAHRVAVLWDEEDGRSREGVFVPRRDTDSAVNRWLGGRVFPGEQHEAEFDVSEREGEISLSMRSADGEVAVDVVARPARELPPTSIFRSLAESSAFFEAGSLGYSATSDPRRLDGLELDTAEWRVEPLDVERVRSSFFADEAAFPRGSAEFDHALFMRDVRHRWLSAPDLRVGP